MARYPRRFGTLVGILLLCTLVASGPPRPAPAAAAAITPEAALVRLLTVSPVRAAWFAPAFLAQVPIARIVQTIASLETQFGPYRGVGTRPDRAYLVQFGRGTAVVQIHLDATGRIDGLLLTDLQFTNLARATAVSGLRALPGRVSVLVLAGGVLRLAIDPDAPLAVGSAFKLAVLAAVRRQVAAHRLSWTRQVTLLASDTSLPSGTLQDSPAGSRYPLGEVARRMIAISDNTAANVLIRVAGRAAIDPLLPARDRPVLTTREFFVLKDPANRALRDRYLAAATPAARLAILDRADRLPLPALLPFARLLAAGPVSPRIEWFLSARQLCGLIGRVSGLPQMGVNPGLATRSEWAKIAFKGGSETGVLNLTTQVTARDGTTYCVAATWNDGARLDEGRFEALYSSLLHSFR